MPGILGSQLLRPDGTEAWLNLGNALGYHDIGLPLHLPLAESRDDLEAGPAPRHGPHAPRMFGFTEYADVVDLLEDAGFLRDRRQHPDPRLPHLLLMTGGADLVESARRLEEHLDHMAERLGPIPTRGST